MIQDELSLLEGEDYAVVARIYQWQAMAGDREMADDYRDHYRKRIVKLRDELNCILQELDRAQ